MVYRALGQRVCDYCVEGGKDFLEYITEALEKRAEEHRRKARRYEWAAAEGVEIAEISLVDRAKADLWGKRHIQDHFGVCPACGGQPQYLNVGRCHWFYCEDHQVCWFVGSNLFSSWKNEDEETWRKNEEKLRDYRVVYVEAQRDLDLVPEDEAVSAAESRIGRARPDNFDDIPF